MDRPEGNIPYLVQPPDQLGACPFQAITISGLRQHAVFIFTQLLPEHQQLMISELEQRIHTLEILGIPPVSNVWWIQNLPKIFIMSQEDRIAIFRSISENMELAHLDKLWQDCRNLWHEIRFELDSLKNATAGAITDDNAGALFLSQSVVIATGEAEFTGLVDRVAKFALKGPWADTIAALEETAKKARLLPKLQRYTSITFPFLFQDWRKVNCLMASTLLNAQDELLPPKVPQVTFSLLDTNIITSLFSTWYCSGYCIPNS